ncbi:taste receptor type 2 member 40-like [Phyllobates terribilis]|uniref:taste receptor type 2 member 40-like n=1 Tax=Phyllobates terribilis TaxID=111132 RepID=UPI003CCAE80B
MGSFNGLWFTSGKALTIQQPPINRLMELGAVALMDFIFLDLSVGLFSNMLITFISCGAWRRGGHQSPADTILLSLGLCNVLMQSLLICSIIIYHFWIQIFLSDHFFRWLYGVYTPITACSSWMTSWLCIFYCIKITTFQFRFFVWMKSRFCDALPWLIFTSIVLSFVVISPLSANLSTSQSCSSNTEWRSNAFLLVVETSEFLPIIVLWCCLPCLLIFMSLGLTMVSLVLHVLRMKKSSSFMDSQITAHVNSIKTMAFLLALYVTFCSSQLILLLNIFPFGSTEFWFFLLLNYSFCSLQGIILILGNPKLYNTLLKVYNFMKIIRI